jgi:excinuclease ABC subunit A
MADLDNLFDRAKGRRPPRPVHHGPRRPRAQSQERRPDDPARPLVVFTGLSGSGKSSLAFDTIYAEGQRRYVESLSAYARQFLEMMSKPDVDQIDGLSPAISIEQKTTSRNPRSTVGTVTEIYDYMRLLWARVGIPYSPATGLPIESQTVSQMVDRVLELPEKTRLYLLAPVVRGRKGEYRKEIAEFQKRGFQRLKVDGEYYAIDEVPTLDKKFKHDIDVVVDRIVVRADIAARLADSLRDRAGSRRRHRGDRVRRRDGGDGEPEAHHLLAAFACPDPASRSPRSSRGCSRSTIPSAPARPAAASATSAHRPGLVVPGREPDPEARRHRALGEVDLALLRPDAGEHRPALQGRPRPPGASCPRRSAGHPLRLRRSRSASPMTTACAPTR